MRRKGPKPIGWALQEQYVNIFTEEAHNIANPWRLTWDLHDLTTELQIMTQCGRPRQVACMKASCSTTEDHIKSQNAEAENSNERRMLYKQLWTKRKQTAAEKEDAQMTHILQNLQSGGWGKKTLTRKMKGMTQLHIDGDSFTTDATRISALATKYYRELFQPKVDEADMAREQILVNMLRDNYEAVDYPTAHITAEHPHLAIISCSVQWMRMRAPMQVCTQCTQSICVCSRNRIHRRNSNFCARSRCYPHV